MYQTIWAKIQNLAGVQWCSQHQHITDSCHIHYSFPIKHKDNLTGYQEQRPLNSLSNLPPTVSMFPNSIDVGRLIEGG